VDAMIDKADLHHIKNTIENCIGLKIQLKSNKGRKKSMINEGILENTYQSIFVVKYNTEFDTTRRISFSYTDVLTKSVEVVVYKDDKAYRVC
jgi:uncharacterized protein Veg